MKHFEGNYFIDSNGDKHWTHSEIIALIREQERIIDIMSLKLSYD